MTTLEIYFNDLKDEVQRDVLGILNTSEELENWNMVPMFVLEREEAEEQEKPTVQDRVYDVLKENSTDFLLMGLDQRGALVGDVVDMLTDHFDDCLIVTACSEVLDKWRGINEEGHNKDGEPTFVKEAHVSRYGSERISMKCRNCGSSNIKYVADLAAPGTGQSWQCENCGIALYVVGNRAMLFSDIDPTDVDMDPSSVA